MAPNAGTSTESQSLADAGTDRLHADQVPVSAVSADLAASAVTAAGSGLAATTGHAASADTAAGNGLAATTGHAPTSFTLQEPALGQRPAPPAPADLAERRHIVFVAWRDLANPSAGGSELLVDRLAQGMVDRGHRVSLLCAGPVADRDYQVVANGGMYTQFFRAPAAYTRRLRDCDLVVEVCNGMPYLAPLWARRPVVCLVNHVHSELWRLRFAAPVAAVGRLTEARLMPWAHRKNLFLTVSESTVAALRSIGVDAERIRLICNGVEPAPPPAPRSAEPLFLALGRLADYKRIDLLLRLWERVRLATGGRLVIAGDGPARSRLEAMAGQGVTFPGRVSEEEKHQLLSAAWLLLHPAMIEGWGIVVAEAAVRGTPAIGFSVPGLRDSVVTGKTGVLVATEGQFASAWASLALDHGKRLSMGRAARERALQLHWSVAVDGFSRVAAEAIARTQPGASRAPAGAPQ